MPAYALNSTLFDQIESSLQLPQVALDYQQQLDWMTMGYPAADPVVLQLSSSLIRISQDLWVDGNPDPVTLELRVSGSGLQPVSSMSALIAAINDGLATGTLSKFAIRAEGVEVLTLTLGASGYVLASGTQSVTLSGKLPLTFTQFYDLADLYTQAYNIDYLTQDERLALFEDLAAYSVTGLTVRDGADTLFAASVTSTTASLTLNGMTITLKGNFPDNLGEDLSLLWDAFSSAARTGDITALARFTAADLSVTSATITNADGKVLASVADPLDGTPDTFTVDGRSFDEVRMDDPFQGGLIEGIGGNTRSVLAGLDGNDEIYGFGGSDRLYGGSGNDDLDGGLGGDMLVGGTGRDKLTGGGSGDVFVFNLRDGKDRITDFAEGLDVIRMTAANRLGDLTFTKVGTDVQIDFRTIHILVEDITIAQLRQIDNFQF